MTTEDETRAQAMDDTLRPILDKTGVELEGVKVKGDIATVSFRPRQAAEIINVHLQDMPSSAP